MKLKIGTETNLSMEISKINVLRYMEGWGSFKVLKSSKIQNCSIKLKIGMDTNLDMEILKMNVSHYWEMVGQGCKRSGKS